MRVTRDPRFVRDYADLPTEIRKRAKSKLALFLASPRHPSLRTKKMEGWDNIWEGHISKDYCFTFSIEGDLYKLRRIGTHAIYRNP